MLCFIVPILSVLRRFMWSIHPYSSGLLLWHNSKCETWMLFSHNISHISFIFVSLIPPVMDMDPLDHGKPVTIFAIPVIAAPCSNWGFVCQKQISMTGTSNYIPQILWDVITCPCPWYLLLALKSSIRFSDNDSTGFWPPGLLHTLGADGHI